MTELPDVSPVAKTLSHSELQVIPFKNPDCPFIQTFMLGQMLCKGAGEAKMTSTV